MKGSDGGFKGTSRGLAALQSHKFMTLTFKVCYVGHMLRIPDRYDANLAFTVLFLTLILGPKKYTHIRDLGSFLTPENFPSLYTMEGT